MLKRLTILGLSTILAAGLALAQTSGLATFTAPLSPSSENPPIEGVDAGGNAVVLIHMTRNSAGALTRAVVDFHIDLNTNGAETFRAMHIHRGARGANGGVVIDSNFGTPIDAAAGSQLRLTRQNIVDDADGLAVVEEVLANPAGFYVNLHSASNPGGIVRGQLMPSDAAAISGLQSQIDGLAAANAEMAEELAAIKETLSRTARRLGVVPKE